jgi:tetratricopeptide (TPR) repeat protein
MKEKLIVLLLSVFVILGLLEASLWIMGTSSFRSRGDEKIHRDKESYIILCLGDSFTYGIGAAVNESYPKQLEQLLNSNLKGKRFVVVNKGELGQNTTLLIDRLQENIDKIKPDLIVLMTGGANNWNYVGYNKYSRGKDSVVQLYNLLSRFRVYKLFKLLYLNIRDKQIRRKNNFLFGQQVKIEVPHKGRREGRVETTKPDESQDSLIARNSVSRFQERIKLNPADGSNYYGIGLVYHKAGNYEEAKRWFREGIRANPGFSRNYNGLGFVFEQQRNYDEAMRWFKEALNLAANDSLNHYGIGLIYLRQSKYEEAVKWFKEGMRLEPGNSDNYFGMGQVCKAQGNYDEAVKWFEEAIRINPLKGKRYFRLADVYIIQGKYGQAIEWLKKGMMLEPSDFKDYEGIIRIFKDKVKYQEGIAFFKQLAQVEPKVNDFLKLLEAAKGTFSKIRQWVINDTEKIIKICKANKVPIILQNYPENYGFLGVLKAVALRNSIPFIDNDQTFKQMFSKGYRRNDYFVPNNHCNQKGYGIIAKNIYNKIIEFRLTDGDN